MNGMDTNADVFRSAYLHGREFTGRGEIPDYIPELASADIKNNSLSVRTLDGMEYGYGDTDIFFTIQSMVKVPILITALEELGEYRVFKKVGMKPSNQAFNSVVGLELSGRIPANPFINAGAIALVNLLGNDAYGLVLKRMKKLMGREDITYSEEVFRSEYRTGEINRALSYMMKASGILKKEVDVESVLTNYFKLCSVLVNTSDLASMGSVIAGGGLSTKGERITDERINHIVRTLMSTCGMYDYSGEFAMAAGIPAKSGVSGGIVALSSGRMGIGVYSPGLDEHGNSVAGMKMLSFISNALDLSIYK